jgi:hypothetical protein
VQVGAGRSEDDLTHQLATIIKCNNTLRVNIQKGEAPHIIQEVRTRPGSRGRVRGGRGLGGNMRVYVGRERGCVGRGGVGVGAWVGCLRQGCPHGGRGGWPRAPARAPPTPPPPPRRQLRLPLMIPSHLKWWKASPHVHLYGS